MREKKVSVSLMGKILFSMIIVSSSFCDQYQWNTLKDASNAKKIILKKGQILEFCEPCSPPECKLINVETIKIINPEKDYGEVYVNEKGIDLAYTFINENNKWKNLAIFLGLEPTGVSTILDLSKCGNEFNANLQKTNNSSIVNSRVRISLPQKIQKDTTPPTITITSPSGNRSLKKASESRIQIIGNATDTNGIAEVSVNGIMATLDAKGNFSSESLLRVGENNIVINATDTFGNIASKNITVERDGGVVASQKIDTTLGNVGKYKALLIGVDNYQDKNIKSLDNPIKDALALEKILKNDYGFETVVLKDPSRAEIIKSFDMIRKELSVNDSLIIFYAGHGYWDEEEKLGYWLPANAEKSNTAEWLPNSSIKDQLSRIQTKHTLLIADACFSGGIFKTRKAFDDNKVTSELFKLPSRKAMTSGTLKEVPDESVFIKYLLKRLKENEKKNLSAGTLFGSMRDAIISNNSLGLVPQYGEVNGAGDEGGDFIFMKR